jgi:hypothetical protein
MRPEPRTYLRKSQKLREAGANVVFASEGEVAPGMTAFLLRQRGAIDEQIDRECERVRRKFFASEGHEPWPHDNRCHDLDWKIRASS